jgi:hypothetical protein
MRLFDLSHVVRANAVAAIACALSAVPVRADPPPVPVRMKLGDVVSGELLGLKTRAKGKRVVTFQLTSGPYRIPGPDGLCNLENGPQTFQIVAHSDAEAKQLRGFVGKSVSIRINEVACADKEGQVTDAVVTKWALQKGE